MLGKKTLKKARVLLNEDAYRQWNLVAKEIDILCEKTGMSWDLTDSKLFDKVRRVCFKEGVIVGIGITIGALAVNHHYSKIEKETEEV